MTGWVGHKHMHCKLWPGSVRALGALALGVVLSITPLCSHIMAQALQHVMRAFSPALAPKAVVLNIDSPGGSPGTTEMISSLIRKQSQQTKVRKVAMTR